MQGLRKPIDFVPGLETDGAKVFLAGCAARRAASHAASTCASASRA